MCVSFTFCNTVSVCSVLLFVDVKTSLIIYKSKAMVFDLNTFRTVFTYVNIYIHIRGTVLDSAVGHVTDHVIQVKS